MYKKSVAIKKSMGAHITSKYRKVEPSALTWRHQRAPGSAPKRSGYKKKIKKRGYSPKADPNQWA